jgi:glycosyltransferase involved in cell wall biosynthesis
MHTRKKILVFSDWFLPGFKAGGPIRSLANLVHSLDVDFWIVTRITDHHSTQPYHGFTAGVWTTHRENVQVCYLHETEVTSQFIKQLIQQQPFDFIYFNSLFSPTFTILPLRIARSMGLAERCVLAPRGMLKPGALSIKANKKKVFLLISRLLGWFKNIRWHATNEQEELEIKQHYGKSSKVFIAPNLASIIASSDSTARKESGQLRLVSIARISAEKGIREALQFLKSSDLHSGVECVFYGTQQDQAYLDECHKLASQIPGATITFPGEIAPEEIPNALEHAHFFYMSTWGENFGHAIAEALQHGKPAIVSDRTPWRNLTAAHAGWDLPLEAKPFADVLRLCHAMSQEEYTTWSKAARAFGSAHANDPKHLKSYYALFA